MGRMSKKGHTSGLRLTFESQRGFPADSMHASLAHANRNFHYSQACRPPPSEGARAGSQYPHKHVWRAEIVLLSADGVGTNEIMRRTGKSKTCVWRWQERFMQAGWLTGWPTSACVQRIAIAVIYSA